MILVKFFVVDIGRFHMVMPLTKSKHTTINVIAKIDENEVDKNAKFE